MNRLGLQELLRFVLAGGHLIALHLARYPTDRGTEWGLTQSAAVLALSLLLGSIIYVMHRAVIYPVIAHVLFNALYGWRRFRNRRSGRDETGIPGFTALSLANWLVLRYWVMEQNKEFGNRIEGWGAQVQFLYTLFVSAAAAYAWGVLVEVRAPENIPHHYMLTWVLVCLATAVINDFRLFCYMERYIGFPKSKYPMAAALIGSNRKG